MLQLMDGTQENAWRQIQNDESRIVSLLTHCWLFVWGFKLDKIRRTVTHQQTTNIVYSVHTHPASSDAEQALKKK